MRFLRMLLKTWYHSELAGVSIPRSHPPFTSCLTTHGVYHGVCFALVSGELSAEKRLADMSKRGNGYGSETRVNILKKVKVGRNWNLYPAVVEPNGKLRDKVRVRGKVELHPEGYYYIEWWQDGRKREQTKDRAEVVDRARRKALELEANRAGIETVQENGDGTAFTLAEAVASYLKDMEPPQREPKTYVAYKHFLELFASNCAKRYIQDVKREDLL